MAELSMMDVYGDEGLADPYPLYRRIRETDPVYWDSRMGEAGGWMVTGYDAAIAALMDTRMSARRPHWSPDRLPAGASDDHVAAMRALGRQVVTSDAPDHPRLRSQLKRSFMPRRVDPLRARVQGTADHLLDAALRESTGEFDAMGAFGFALPAVGLCQLLGLPLDQDYLRWMFSLGLLIDDGPAAVEHQPKLLSGVSEYVDFFRTLVAKRHGERHEDLLQTLADALTQGEFADEEELLANLAFLLTAGQISTAHQIGNTLLHLLRDPELYEVVRSNPDVLASLTPELMRFDASIQLTKRRVREPLELGGHELPVGSEVFVWLGAANRDPQAFPDPDRIDPDRARMPHLVFGRGAHYCIGAHLGTLVHDIAIQTFVDRVPHPRLIDDGKVERSIMPTFRGPYRLPVAYGARVDATTTLQEAHR